mgnify:CR=1 FL=1
MAVVTGPNGCGKSVYLKSVGLVVYMAQIGCFVPAAKALVGVADRIFTRIHSLETASLRQSTFAIDVSQVGAMLHHATPRSLLLIDEFGKGTSSTGAFLILCALMVYNVYRESLPRMHAPSRTIADGVALLAATMRALLRGGAAHGHRRGNPRCVITTHFREVLDLHTLESSPVAAAAATPVTPPRGGTPAPAAAAPPDVAYYHMQAIIKHLEGAQGGGGGADGGTGTRDGGEADDDGSGVAVDTVVPLFQLVPGRAAASYGFACAAMAGMPAGVVARARAVSAALAAGKPVTPPAAYLASTTRAASHAAAMRTVAALLATLTWAPPPPLVPSAPISPAAAAAKGDTTTPASVAAVADLLRAAAVV